MGTLDEGGKTDNNVIKQEFKILGKDFTSAGEASSTIKYTLQHIGYDYSVIRRTAIASYEAEMNIVIHADSGVIQTNITPEYIEIIAEDEGPGIADIGLAMKEGYSTAPDHIREMGFGAGMGLPNIKRCADDFNITSEVGKGTRLRLVIYNKEIPVTNGVG